MKTSSVKVSIVKNELSPAMIDQMWSVYQKYYNYSQTYFLERLNKNNYFSLYQVGDEIVGFTGLRINRTKMNGKKRLLINFGQTIVEKAYRGKSLIPATGAKLCMLFPYELLFHKTYFWADCLTYKAYLVFAKTLEEYYPSYKYDPSEDVRDVIDYIGATHYADSYCPKTGTVNKESIVVNDVNTSIPEKYKEDQDINYYAQANSQFETGNGLITLGPVNFTNFSLLIKRFVKQSLGIHPKQKLSISDPIHALSNALRGAIFSLFLYKNA